MKWAEAGCGGIRASLSSPSAMIKGDFSLRGLYPLPNLFFPYLQLFLLREGPGHYFLLWFSWLGLQVCSCDAAGVCFKHSPPAPDVQPEVGAVALPNE